MKAPSLLKRIMAALSSKTNEMRTRIMIFFLLRNKTMLMDSFSDKLQALVGGGHHHRHGRHHKKDDDNQEETKALVTQRSTANNFISSENEAEAVVVNAASAEGLDFDPVGGEVIEEGIYPNLTHSLLKESEEEMELTKEEEEEDDNCTSLFRQQRIPEEDGSNGDEREDIDQAADLFIERFRRQIQLQKQESFNKYQQKIRSSV